MSLVRLAVSAASLGMAISRNPAARAALRSLPKAVPYEVKQAAFNSAKGAAYRAGVMARHVMGRDKRLD